MSDASAATQILVSRSGPVATITLNRPEKLNAITLAMLSALDAALVTIDADTDVRVVVITGAGPKAFSAGADVVAWSSLAPLDMWRSWTRIGHQVMERLESLRQPTIASLNGIAYGGGLELALACDLQARSRSRHAAGAGSRDRDGPRLGHDHPARHDRGPRPGQADDPDGHADRRGAS